ncbi:hypothetical protein T484DRAFT_3543624 [Baffinella frigidus]|nr:hypothetical protein T484DRAFT_3543624 [Cryptophyta sp. CCMP2293]
MGERADRGLLEAMQRRATATAGEFKPQDIANMLWALAAMGERADQAILSVLLDRFAARVLEFRDTLTSEDKSQLHQWLLSCALDLEHGLSAEKNPVSAFVGSSKNLKEPGGALPRGVARVQRELGEECLLAFAGQGSHESQLQRHVANALRGGWPEVEIEEEFRDVRSGYSIDVLVRRRSGSSRSGGTTNEASNGGRKVEEVPGVKWAVEVDGPTHYLGDARTPSGSTLLKRKQLGQLGYTVVPVPFWEWDALGGEEAKLRRYLGDKLPTLRSEKTPTCSLVSSGGAGTPSCGLGGGLPE